MVQRITYLLLPILLAAGLTVRGDIDLTPSTATRQLGGLEFPELIFLDGGKPVSYEHPRGWTYSVIGPAKIRFYSPHVTQASAQIEAVTIGAGAALDEKAIRKLRDEVTHSLPKDSSQIQVISEVTNPLLINGRATYEVTVAYLYYGQRFRQSVLFSNLGRQQLRCKVVACTQDFDKVYRPFCDSLCSLQWLGTADQSRRP